MLIALLLAATLDEPVTAAAPPPPVAPAPAVVAQGPNPFVPGVLRVPKADDTAKALRFVWRDHPSLRAGRNLRLDFTLKVQEDYRDPGDDPVDFPDWELHRARIGVDGELFRKIQFQIEREFSENLVNDPTKSSTKSQWKDVYVEANLSNALQIRVGKFKVPFGLDQNTGEVDLDFVYRSLGGDYLSPGRDIGGMVHGRFLNRGLYYWFGGFKQDGENSRSSKIAGADTTFAGRLTAAVLRKTGVAFLKDAQFGGSFATSELSDEAFQPNGLRARTVMTQHTFFEPVFVKGTRRRYGAEMELASGRLGARGEYIFVGDSRDEQGFGNQNLSTVRGKGWNVLASWVLSGEKRERPVVPRKGGLGRGGVGAVEVSARYDALRFDSPKGIDPPFRNSRAETILPNGDKVVTLGLNYYANRFVKIQINGIRETIEDPERSPTLDAKPFWSTVVRFQFQL